MPRTLYRPASSGYRSVSTFTTIARPAISAAVRATSGTAIRQGPHHSAQKSTSTGTRAVCLISSNCSGSTARVRSLAVAGTCRRRNGLCRPDVWPECGFSVYKPFGDCQPGRRLHRIGWLRCSCPFRRYSARTALRGFVPRSTFARHHSVTNKRNNLTSFWTPGEQCDLRPKISREPPCTTLVNFSSPSSAQFVRSVRPFAAHQMSNWALTFLCRRGSPACADQAAGESEVFLQVMRLWEQPFLFSEHGFRNNPQDSRNGYQIEKKEDAA